MSRQTRAQHDFILAEKLVSEVEGREDAVKKIYGGLCHAFPVLVRTCGLAQAVAFSQAKATPNRDGADKPRVIAHCLLLQHVAALLGPPEGGLAEAIRTADAQTYMLHTRRVLGAWIYFKRFAVSILKVEDARPAEEGRDDAN